MLSRIVSPILLFVLLDIASPLFGQDYWAVPVAGRTRFQEGGQVAATPLRAPTAVVRDRTGNLYIADRYDARILRVSPTGVVTTYAGTGFSGFTGDGGPANMARIGAQVTGMAIDRDGTLYFADTDNYRVRKITPAGVISTVIGTGRPQFNANFIEGGPATASVITPWSVALDGQGNLYVSDASIWISLAVGSGVELGLRFSVRKIDLRGNVTTVAGGGPPEFRGDGGPAKDARVGDVEGLAVDAAGNLYLSDAGNFRVRKVSVDGVITTIAGNGQGAYSSDNTFATGTGLTPAGLAVDANGDVYVADEAASRIRRIDARTGLIATVAGSATFGFQGDGGLPTNARLARPSDVFLTAPGEFLIADTLNGRVRRVARATIDTVAGAGDGAGGLAAEAFLNQPTMAIADPQGGVLIADRRNHSLRRVSPTGQIARYAGDGYPGFWDGTSSLALFQSPMAMVSDQSGAIYVADTENHRIRKIANGVVTTIAGTGVSGFSGDGGAATGARLSYPTGVATDALFNIYIADWGNSRVRRIAPNGVITTVAGNGRWQFVADGMQATVAQVDPFAVAVSRTGEMFIADRDNHRIRRVDLSGVISTAAGSSPGFSGDGGAAAAARLFSPSGVAFDSDGNLFIADYDNFRVRRIDTRGTITTIAGNGLPRTVDEGGPALQVGIDPFSVSVDSRGNLFIAEPFNDRVRRIYPRTVSAAAAASAVQLAGTTGQAISDPLVVRIVDTTGAPMQGVRVRFAVTSGAARLDPAEAVTDASGLARSTVLLGDTPGEVVVTATVAGIAPVTFRITVTAARPGPRIDPGGVVGAGLTRPPVRALTPKGLMTIFGQNFFAGTAIRQVTEADYENGRVPARFAGVCVQVGEVRAPILVVTATQITFQSPRVPPGTTAVPVRVITACGTADEQRSAPETVEVRSAAPEFFYFLQRSDGTNPVAAANAVTGRYVGLPGMISGVEFAPAQPGDVLTVYLTGVGQTNPDFEPGEAGDRAARATGAVRVWIGQTELAAEDVLYTGITPFSPGLYQLNLRVPAGTGDGDHRLLISVDGAQSPPPAVLIVRR
ncbi:MAG TPA: hypothetical protein DEH78_06790 [Solibacterales bacterium]|nr:hypothetical protein [Bryobacterales bacterium]